MVINIESVPPDLVAGTTLGTTVSNNDRPSQIACGARHMTKLGKNAF
jgi:hypothetical protein